MLKGSYLLLEVRIFFKIEYRGVIILRDLIENLLKTLKPLKQSFLNFLVNGYSHQSTTRIKRSARSNNII